MLVHTSELAVGDAMLGGEGWWRACLAAKGGGEPPTGLHLGLCGNEFTLLLIIMSVSIIFGVPNAPKMASILDLYLDRLWD